MLLGIGSIDHGYTQEVVRSLTAAQIRGAVIFRGSVIFRGTIILQIGPNLTPGTQMKALGPLIQNVQK